MDKGLALEVVRAAFGAHALKPGLQCLRGCQREVMDGVAIRVAGKIKYNRGVLEDAFRVVEVVVGLGVGIQHIVKSRN